MSVTTSPRRPRNGYRRSARRSASRRPHGYRATGTAGPGERVTATPACPSAGHRRIGRGGPDSAPCEDALRGPLWTVDTGATEFRTGVCTIAWGYGLGGGRSSMARILVTSMPFAGHVGPLAAV